MAEEVVRRVGVRNTREWKYTSRARWESGRGRCPAKRVGALETGTAQEARAGAAASTQLTMWTLRSSPQRGSWQSYCTRWQVLLAVVAAGWPRRAHSSQDCTNCCSRCSPEEMRVSEKWVQVQPVLGVVFFTVFRR